MGRLPREKMQRFLNAPVRLLRYTRWKCGRLERAIINFLWNRRIRRGRAEAKVGEIIMLGIKLGSRNETLDALRRLQRRRIVRIGGSK